MSENDNKNGRSKKDSPLATLKETLLELQKKFLRPTVYFLLIALALYPLIPWEPYKILVLFLLATALVRLICDVDKDIQKNFEGINERLDHVSATLKGPNPPTWEDYTAAQNAILKDISDAFESGNDVVLEIIGVSARYSWRMVEDHLTPVLRIHEDRKLRVDVAMCTPDTLAQWKLERWAQDLRRTVNGIDDFLNTNRDAVESNRLTINIYSYDNLPQWHGVLINHRILYMGRTEWLFQAETFPALKVGQCPYRKFEPADRYGGHPRIKMFSNWMERLRRRDAELKGEAQQGIDPNA